MPLLSGLIIILKITNRIEEFSTKLFNKRFLIRQNTKNNQLKLLSIARLKEKVLEQNIIQLQKRMQETWSNNLNVQRGNPVRTFSGSDFKKNYQEKSFKKQRNHLKSELKNYKNDLN